MVVNNWYVTVNMYIAVMGNAWPILFFTTFWVLTVLIMLNLVVSFVIESYNDSC